MAVVKELTFKDRDEFKREGVAKKLLNLLESDAPASPILLDGPWGSGKTEFCHKLVNLSVQQGSQVKLLYIDAYKFDHSDAPLLMLIAGVSSVVENSAEKSDLLRKAVPVAKALGKIAGKAAVSWALRSNADRLGEELSEAVTSEGEDLVDQGVKRLFQNFEKVEENLNLYRSALVEVAKKQTIAIIIDELDRCRPVFALSVLEKVKHVFDVEGIKFLFCTNMPQLCSIVKKQYGPDINAEKYLGKFFNFVVKLPNDHSHNGYEYVRNASSLFSGLVAQTDFKTLCAPDSSIMSFIKALIERDHRSLRDVETYHRNILIYNSVAGEYAIKENTIWMYAALIMLAIYIYTFERDFTAKLLNGTWNLDDASGFFGKKLESLGTVERDLLTLIFAMFVLELDPPVESNGLSEKSAKEWEQEIYRCFTHGRGPSRGQRVAVIQKAIRRMQLT